MYSSSPMSGTSSRASSSVYSRSGASSSSIGHHVPAPEGTVVAVVAVDLDAHVDVLLEAFLGGRRQGLLQGSEHDVLFDVLFPRQGIDQKQ